MKDFIAQRKSNNPISNEIGYYFSWHFRNEGVSVVDYGIFVLAIPEIKLNTTTSAEQCLSINFDRGFSGELVTYRFKQPIFMSKNHTGKKKKTEREEICVTYQSSTCYETS